MKNAKHPETRTNGVEVRKFALIAIGLYILSEALFSILSLLTRGQTLSYITWANAIMTVFVRWIPPFLIAIHIEKRGADSLGITIRREKYVIYAVGAFIGLILPAIFVRDNKGLITEFIEQIVYIGLLEEFFYRGYLMTRLCNWLGNGKGLFWSSFIFGLGHVISRVADHGFGIMDKALLTGGQAFLGGLIFGLIYLKARNIWPGAALHVSTNMYLYKFIEMFGF